MKQDASGWIVRLDDAQIACNTRSGAWRNETISELAYALALREPERTTHVFEERSYCIGELVRDAESLAAALAERGLRAGDVISFQLPNWVEAVVIDLAAAMLGLVIAPIISIYRDGEVAFMLANCGAKAVFVPGDYRGFDYVAMMQRVRAQLPQLQLLASIRHDASDQDSYEALIAECRTLAPQPRVDPNAVKLVLYTSGTTGKPKGVMHSHNTLSFCVQSAMQHWRQGEGDSMLMASPVTHVTGFGLGLELPMLCGTRVVFMERWNATEGVKLIDAEKISVSMGATPFLHELLTEAERQNNHLPTLRLYGCGGAAVPTDLVNHAVAWFDDCRIFRMFGSSEVPLVALGFVGDGQAKLAAETDGEVVHYDVKIVDDEGKPLPNNTEGEICARGPAMMLGYIDAAQSAESIDADGYFHMGDLGIFTDDHAIVVTGRKKDLINRGGEKISAREIEDVLLAHKAVSNVAVVAMPHPRLGEGVCAYVVVKGECTFTFENMTACMKKAGLARQKYPEKLLTVDHFPMTASGKIRKDVLRADIRDRLQSEKQYATGIA